MKLTFIAIILCATGVFATEVNSQTARVNLSMQNAKTGDIIDAIEKQTDYLFVYAWEEIDVEQRASIEAENQTVAEVLTNLFRNTDIVYAVEGTSILLMKNESTASGQQQDRRRVMGKITDEEGEAVIGASVVEKGTANGVVTDINGNYSLSVNEGATLRVSYIGYLAQEAAVNDRSNINFVLEEDALALEEVVVVGYGTMRRKDVTGAISSIAVDKIDKSSIKSIDQMLQGRSAGLHMAQSSGMPGAGSTIRIRGGNSISGGNEPLYVIDGIPIYPAASSSQMDLNPLNSIAVTDIQSIEILKDASSTAIYGARGANGVIMITTKKGEAGKTKVSLDAYWGIQNVRKKYDLLNAREYEEYVNEAYENAGSKVPYDLSLTPANTDWQDLILQKNAIMQNYALSVSGGDAKTRFLMTLNYVNQDGIVKETEMEKITLRTNLDRDVSDNVKMGVNLSLAQVNSNRVGLGAFSYRTLKPNIPLYDEDGNYSTYNMQGGLFSNPMVALEDKVSDNERFRTLANMYFDWQIFKGLSFRTTYGVDLLFANQNTYEPLTTVTGAGTGGDATINNNKQYMWVNENTLTYANVFGRHRINVMAGMTQQSSRTQTSQAESQGFLNDNLTLWDMGSGTNAVTPSSGSSQWALMSYLGRVNYNLDEKYLVTASFRADGSSRFGKSNRWGYFPSGAIAWRASEEEFIQSLGVFSNLKVRASYGWTGNQDGIGTYPSMALLGKSAYSLGNTKYMGYAPTQVANTKLKWETTRQVDLGLEMGFFNNRLGLTADFYHKKTHDLLLRVQIPSTSGYGTGLKNVGKVENKGVEFAVSASPFVQNFRWDIDFNISFNKNKVVDMGDVTEMIPSDVASESDYGLRESRLLRVGEPLGIFYGYKSDGIFSTTDDIANSAQPNAKPGDIRYVDVNDNGSIDEGDRVVLGSAQPDFFGGFTNSFSYKGFDLNVFVVFSYGADIYNATKAQMEALGGADNQFRSILNRWTEDNQNTNIPRAVTTKPTAVSWDYLVEDGSYLRIQNINLGYTFSNKALAFTRCVESLRLYVSLQNFFTFTNYSGLDPEVSRYGQNNVALNYDLGGYPTAKTVMFGVNVNF